MKTCMFRIGMALLATSVLASHSQAQGILNEFALYVNEFNAVSKSNFLNNDQSDTRFGRIQGNGGDWIELVVRQDHLDIRNWSLRWAEVNEELDPGASRGWYTDPMDPNKIVENGIIHFADVSLWSDLRAGTIITISEKQSIAVHDGGVTDQDDIASVPFSHTIHLDTDASYNPAQGDLSIHVSTLDELNTPLINRLITTETNVPNDGPGNFSVGAGDWVVQIVKANGEIASEIGEDLDTWGGGGVKNDEIGRYEANPTIFSQSFNFGLYNDGRSSTFGSPNIWDGGSQEQDFTELSVPEPASGVLLGCLYTVLFRRGIGRSRRNV